MGKLVNYVAFVQVGTAKQGVADFRVDLTHAKSKFVSLRWT
jgi:hypothetical protein